MDYAIKLNVVNNTETKVRAFAAVTLGDCFKITNVAVVEGKEGRLFVSMPSFKGGIRKGRRFIRMYATRSRDSSGKNCMGRS